MKRILFALVLTIPGSAFADAVSNMVQTALTNGQAAFTQKSTTARNTTLCQLVSSDGDLASIGPALLGSYAQSSEQKGIQEFYTQMPSIAVTKLVENASKASSASIVIDNSSTDNGDGTYSVGATATYNGSTYDATIIVALVGSKYQIVDATYLGFSAINYLGNQIQGQIGDYTDSTPVADWVKAQDADASFITCP